MFILVAVFLNDAGLTLTDVAAYDTLRQCQAVVEMLQPSVPVHLVCEAET